MQTKALRSFNLNHSRIINLLSFYDFVTEASRGKPSKDCSELGRAAWAQAVTSLDAYLHDVLAERLALSIAKSAFTKNAALQERIEAIVTPEIILALVNSKEPRIDLAKAVAGSYDLAAMQREERVSEILQLLSVDDPWERISSRIEKKGKGPKTAQEIKKRFHEVIERRNRIVHRADVPKGENKAQQMRKVSAQGTLDFIHNLVTAIDSSITEMS